MLSVVGSGEMRAPHDHVVGFYERDDELVVEVMSFFASALDHEGAVVIIATAPHRAAVEVALIAEGYAVRDLTDTGRYVALDAGETLAAFMRGDHPDPAAFAAVMGSVLDDLAGEGPTHAFGEMVALLWDAGNAQAAIELESLWNDLAESRIFSLYCAYAMSSLERSGDLAAAKHVCDRHSSVIRLNAPEHAAEVPPSEGTEFARVFVPAPVVVREVRDFVRDVLRQWGDHALLGEAELIVAELATNAVLHACSPFRVSVSRTSTEVKIAVRDASSIMPANVIGPVDREGGRGISIVAAVSERWATDPEADGKTIWAKLPTSG
jgi:anti-sigma regulatory factor (Ser/Thr protein kinase)